MSSLSSNLQGHEPLSLHSMHAPRDVASIRLDNALALFDEFVRNTIKHPDAATLRGLERRFAERLQIQPSYWSQIKSRSRLIGERLARQFEQCCQKPVGWMDAEHGAQPAGGAAPPPPPRSDSPLPQDDDERFITGLVLTYYRRHPQRARTRLLDLLGEVLMPEVAEPLPAAPAPAPRKLAPGVTAKPPAAPPPPDDPMALWHSAQSGIAPLKKKR
jgi:hypothetical protein